jgi:spore cortex formation protein SpoVR/YcgB (stage V sporulation)
VRDMSRVSKFLDELNDEELYEFEKDMKSGTLQKFIEQKKEYFRIKDKTCATCGNAVNEDCLVLIYGDPRISIRKKAHFCGTDCMEYFINKNIRLSKKIKDDIKK